MNLYFTKIPGFRMEKWLFRFAAAFVLASGNLGVPSSSQGAGDPPQSVRVLKLEREKRVKDFVDGQKARYLAGLEKLRTDWVAQNKVEDALAALKLKNLLEETSDLGLTDAEIVALPSRLKEVVDTWGAAIDKEITEANAALAAQLDAIRVNAIKKGDLDLVKALELEIEASKKLEVSGGEEPIDLLADAHPYSDSFGGIWKIENGALLLDDGNTFKGPYFRLKKEMPVNYRLEVVFTPIDASDSTNFILPIGDRRVELVLNGFPAVEGGPYSGFEHIDKTKVFESPFSVKGKLLEVGQRYHLSCSVSAGSENGSIEVTLDGKNLLSWEGELTALSLSLNKPRQVKESVRARNLHLRQPGTSRTRYESILLFPIERDLIQ